MEDVHAVEVHFTACKHRVGAGVMPERPVMIRRLQDDGVRSGCSCCGGDVLQVHSVLGEQATDDLAKRVVADSRANAGWHPCRRESESGIRDASAEGELCRANLVELARHQVGNTGEFGGDVDAKVPGHEYRVDGRHRPTRTTSPVSCDRIAAP